MPPPPSATVATGWARDAGARDGSGRTQGRDHYDGRPQTYTYHNLVLLYRKVVLMPMNQHETVLLDVFLANQKRQKLIAAALADTELPPEDYPMYVIIGVEGPWTPTELAQRLEMPLTTVLFRLRRLERRGHAERVANPDDGRSFTIRLTPAGQQLLRKARPRFRAYAEAVEERLGSGRVAKIREQLRELRGAIDAEVDAPDGIRTRATALKGL